MFFVLCTCRFFSAKTGIYGGIIFHSLASEYNIQLMNELENSGKIRAARGPQKIRFFVPLTGMDKNLSAPESVIELRIPP